MIKKLLTVLGLTFCMVLVLSFSANACHLDNITLEADCEGFSITGQICGNADYHPVVSVDYSVSLNNDGQIIVFSGSVDYPLTPGCSCDVQVAISDYWGEICGDNIVVEGVANLLFNGLIQDTVVLEPLTLVCPCDVGCNRTPGYWKTHPEAWPVEEITIGGETYSKEEAIAIMEMPVAKDKTYTMYDALVAAKLNVLAGSGDSCVAGIILAADAWMAENGPVGSGVAAGGESSPWRTGESLYTVLDQYNNGELCVPHCD